MVGRRAVFVIVDFVIIVVGHIRCQWSHCSVALYSALMMMFSAGQ